MWSDPEDIETWAVNSRGAGWLFGSKVTKDFCRINDLVIIFPFYKFNKLFAI
jgi:serine/threonine-protein phosphatase 6 catalytic subunit